MNGFDEKRKKIYTVQKWLSTLEGAGMPLPAINPDGIYDGETRTAVYVFQGLMHLPQTGAVDEETWNALKNAAGEAERMCARSLGIYPFECRYRNSWISEGERSDKVYLVQMLLRALEGQFPALAHVEMTGVYDAETMQDVKSLQRIWGLEATGLIDLNTWNMLAGSYNMFVDCE